MDFGLRCLLHHLWGGSRWTVKGYAARARLVKRYFTKETPGEQNATHPQNRLNAPLASAHNVLGRGAEGAEGSEGVRGGRSRRAFAEGVRGGRSRRARKVTPSTGYIAR